MHVKSDIFCAGSVILPDKAARQLNVGGWSLDSTFGVRLYTPDGSDGVNGTNDWEESFPALKLQVHSRLILSCCTPWADICIVSAAVGIPQLRFCRTVLSLLSVARPAATQPLNLTWKYYRNQLAVTPSLNLIGSDALILTICIRLCSFCLALIYLSVSLCPPPTLVSFRAIVNTCLGYWNEARILDPVTFNTVKVLPNIPGSVNNCEGFSLAIPFVYLSRLVMAGRTYPLEGNRIYIFPVYLTDEFLDRCCDVATPICALHRSSPSFDLRWFDYRCCLPGG